MNRYIYTGKISVENNDISLIVDVFIAADELELLEIFQRLEKVLLEDKSTWQSKDIIKILQHDNFTNLYGAALGLVCKSPKIIFESDYFSKCMKLNLFSF